MHPKVSGHDRCPRGSDRVRHAKLRWAKGTVKEPKVCSSEEGKIKQLPVNRIPDQEQKNIKCNV